MASKFPRNRAATLHDVALLANVTRMTVSNVMRAQGRVSQATRQVVMEAASELNYSPNPLAQRLSIGHNAHHVDIYAASLEAGIALEKIKIIQSALMARSYDVPIHLGGFPGKDEKTTTRRNAELIQKLRCSRPRAIVCATPNLAEEVLIELGHYIREGGHVVCFDEETNLACDNVVFDWQHNIYAATHHLLKLGHRRLGLFEQGSEEPRAPIRQGFERALQEFGVSAKATRYFVSPLLNEDAGSRLAQIFLKLKTSERPTAMIAINDRAAFAFMVELERAGVLVPRDVSVIGHDDSPIAKLCSPPLSSLSYPAAQIAEKVVELLLDRLSGEYSGAARRVVVKGELVLRASTAAPARSSGIR